MSTPKPADPNQVLIHSRYILRPADTVVLPLILGAIESDPSSLFFWAALVLWLARLAGWLMKATKASVSLTEVLWAEANPPSKEKKNAAE